MKKFFLLVLFAVAAASARAEWKNVKEGLDQKTALQTLGAPLMVSKSKSGMQQTWTYDRGAYIIFVFGRVRYWAAPKVKQVAKKN